MKGNAETDLFEPEEQQMLKAAYALVKKAPDEFRGRPIRSHELVRAISVELGLPFADGWYGMIEHSWLWTSPLTAGEPLPNILDVYVPGKLPQVQLSVSDAALPYEYRRGDFRRDIDEDVLIQLRRSFAEGKIIVQ